MRMGEYALSNEADADIEQIARQSAEQRGLRQAEAYILALHDTFRSLARFPKMGRDAGALRANCRRFECGVHVVFYRTTKSGILIIRVLHQRMLPENYL